MKVIGVFGKKGGSGKTLVSHYLAHGMSKGLGMETLLFQTDVRTVRPDDFHLKRQYQITSLPNEDPETDLKRILEIYAKFAPLSNLVMVIDGGANRSALDLALAPLCDVVFIPFGYGKEDVDVAENDYWAMRKKVHEEDLKALEQGRRPLKDTRMFMLQNRWPGVKTKLDAIMAKPRVRDFIFKAEASQQLFPKYIPDMMSLTEISNATDPRYTLMIDAQAKTFARYVAMTLGLEVQDDGNYVEVDNEFEENDDTQAA